MQIKIDHSTNRPVYQQIIDQVKRDIALGKIRPGDKLFTVRELAAELAINPNTIAKAYRQLEKDGVIVTRPGAGAFVAEITSNLTLQVRKKILTDDLERTIVEAAHMRISREKLTKWFNNTLDQFNLSDDKE